jgi:flagellar hook-associated protein 1 FlgK
MQAQQQVIDVIGHNVSNASTKGYHRQSAVLTAGSPVSMTSFSNAGAVGQMGTGVTVERIMRYGQEFYDTRYRNEAAITSQYQVEGDFLTQIESQLSEYGKGSLTTNLDEFWSGWQSLSSDPTNDTLRADLLDSAQNLAKAFNHRNEVLIQGRVDLNSSVKDTVDEINTLAQELANLNQEIAHVSATGEQPNDLMDTRDMNLDRLSELCGAQISVQTDGTALVSLNGHSLVFGMTTSKLTVSGEPMTSSITWDDGTALYSSPTDPSGFTDSIKELKGELAGYLDARDNVIPSQQKGLDQLAYQLVNAVNAIHNPDMTAIPAPSNPPYAKAGMDFFTALASANGAAGLISVSSAMENLDNIMGASAAYPGDGTIAQSMANLKDKAITGLNGMTVNDYYTNQAADLGTVIENASNLANSHKTVSNALNEQRESLSGVDLDEEAASLVKAQRMYQAASRMINALDEVLDKIINGTGLVGR